LEGASVKLSTKVTSIETTSAGTVKVLAEDGQFDFDEVVITSPLGWLQRNKHVFSPPLPKRFSQAIDYIGYGSLEKVCYGIPEFNSSLIRF
jgi:monoamine oxidase